MTTDKTTKLVELIRKLLAKANDPSVGEKEAAMFAAKAQELLEEQNMTILDLGDEQAQTESPVGQFTWAPKYAGNTWRKMVADSAARVYMCKLITTQVVARTAEGKPIYDKFGKTKWLPGYILVGRESSTQVAKSMIEYLFSTGVRLSKGYSSNQKARHLFERGYGIRIAQRLEALYEESTKGAKAQASSNLPVLYKNELALADQFVKANMKTRPGREAKIGLDQVHSANGMAAANSVALGHQVGGGSKGAPALPKGNLMIGNS